MHPFETKVAAYIATHSILTDDGRTVLVGLSGGADSVALLAVLSALGYNCTALHCNFRLRGEESERDRRHARDIARKLGADYRETTFDVESRRRADGSSVEMACRVLRYEWFTEVLGETSAQAIAVGHNLTDNVETFFLNLLRGTSLAGLTGMEPRCEATKVARPLLGITREEITDYLTTRRLQYIDDSSNFTTVYRRNQLRLDILPALRRYFPDADERITSTMEKLRLNESFYRRSVDRTMARYTDPDDGSIDLDAMAANEPEATLLLFEHLRGEGLTYTQASDIISSRHKSGRRFPTAKGCLTTHRNRLLRKTMNESPCTDDIDISVQPVSNLRPEECPMTAYFDISLADRLNDIEVRSWREGDRIKPWGMRGSKKLSDIFSDAHIPVSIKYTIPVVTLDNEILWVAGLRNSRLWPVSPDSRHMVVMKLRQSNGEKSNR